MPQMAPHQMQFHHPMMAAQGRPPPAYYPPMNQGGYGAGGPAMDPYRGQVGPMMMNSAGMMPGFGAPPGFGMAGGQGMFPGYPMQFMAPGMAAGPMAGHGRRRVG
jgi:hypothetical protein